MADLPVKERYPHSYRLEHPDFGDVYRTTFKKGVITEFQKLQDDPIKVASKAKVEIEGWGESEDYLPLFYHPKAQYWDDEDGEATAFNEEGKYFEKAWMSFRVDDEVLVMMRENKPYAIVGFYDGKPKIGEDIIKFEWELSKKKTIKEEWPGWPYPPVGVDYIIYDIIDEKYNIYESVLEGKHYCYLQASKRDYYGEVDAEQKGKDGLDLHVIKEIEPFNQSTKEVESESDTERTDIDELRWIINTYSTTTKATITEWLFTIGPILYSFHLLTVEEKSEVRREWWYRDPLFPIIPEGTVTVTVQNIVKYYDYMIQANLYSEELYQRLKTMRKDVKTAYEQWNDPYPQNWSGIDDGSLMMQQGDGDGVYHDNWKSLNFFSPPWSDRGGSKPPYGIDPATFKIYIRPHSGEKEAA